ARSRRRRPGDAPVREGAALMRPPAPALLALALALALAPSAEAATRRLAIVVGHNAGAGETPLRYAEADAARFARVLVELVGVKGGTPGPSFQIRLDDDDLASTGYVFLTSSAGDELALESPEIHGSFFTHHLISGMLGQADVSGDHRVSLAEAYEYAYART